MARLFRRGAGGFVLAWSGCTAPAPRQAVDVSRAAEVMVTNETPYAWRLEFSRLDANDRQVAEIGARDTRPVRLAAAGDYRVTQAIVSPGVDVPSRQVEVRFEAGEQYVWQLATLLTASTGGIESR